MISRPHDPQLLKGILPTLVLAALTAQESYGYELVTRLQDAGLDGVAAGTVYPVLTRLERDGALSARLVESSAGPARKYYRPTPDGAARLAQGLDGWARLGVAVTVLTRAASTTTSDAPREDQP